MKSKTFDRDVSLLIHIGLYKTATTYLQMSVFCKGELGFERVGTRGEMFEHIIFGQSVDWDAARSRAAFIDRIKAAEASGKVPVMSDEHFLGPIGSSFYRYEYILERLKLMFPQARILLTVRDQQATVLSMYAEYVRAGGTLAFPRFIAQVPFEQGFDPEFDKTYLNYCTLLKTIHAHFEPDRVLVLSQNLLRENPLEFWRELKSFAGVVTDATPSFGVVRPSYSLTYLALQRFCNFLTLDRLPNRRRIFIWALFGFLNERVPMRLLDARLKRSRIRAFDEQLGSYYARANRRLKSYLESCLGDRGRRLYRRLMFPPQLEPH